MYWFWLLIDGDISFHQSKGQGRLLDIGCNEGRGLQFYKNNGFEPDGIELNSNATKCAREKGFNVHNGTIVSYSPEYFYDVVVLSNVLEHDLDPVAFLKNINKLLKPGGEIWISCPNDKSIYKSLFGKYWINWHIPFHIFQFTSDNLKFVLNKTGYQLMAKKYQTPSLWITQSLLSFLFAKKGKPTLAMRNPLLVAPLLLSIRLFLFPLLFLANVMGKGDCIVLKATKESA